MLERSGLSVDEINAVEMLGGGSRVPKLQVRGRGHRPLEGTGRMCGLAPAKPPCAVISGMLLGHGMCK